MRRSYLRASSALRIAACSRRLKNAARPRSVRAPQRDAARQLDEVQCDEPDDPIALRGTHQLPGPVLTIVAVRTERIDGATGGRRSAPAERSGRAATQSSI